MTWKLIQRASVKFKYPDCLRFDLAAIEMLTDCSAFLFYIDVNRVALRPASKESGLTYTFNPSQRSMHVPVALMEHVGQVRCKLLVSY